MELDSYVHPLLTLKELCPLPPGALRAVRAKCPMSGPENMLEEFRVGVQEILKEWSLHLDL